MIKDASGRPLAVGSRVMRASPVRGSVHWSEGVVAGLLPHKPKSVDLMSLSGSWYRPQGSLFFRQKVYPHNLVMFEQVDIDRWKQEQAAKWIDEYHRRGREYAAKNGSPSPHYNPDLTAHDFDDML
jgi:hypothetical protein